MLQKCTVSLADDLTEISEFLEEITSGIQAVMQEVSTRLPQVISQFEINLKQNVDKLKSADLTDQMQTAMSHCITESRGKANIVKAQLQELMNKASSLGTGATAQIEQCVKHVSNTEDVAELASCLKQQGASIQEAVDGLRNEIANSLMLTETVVADISSTLDACIEQAEAQTDEHDETSAHTDEL